MLNRRSFLLAAGSGVVAASLAARNAFAQQRGKLPLGIQLYTVRGETNKDVEGTLRKVYELGFREIEFAGYYDKTPADLLKLMHSIGFTLVSTHTNAGEIASKGTQVIADAKALGLKYIICSSPLALGDKDKLPYGQKMDALDLTDWKANAELFNQFGAAVKAAGMTFGYHNHHVEFKTFGGKRAYDELFGWTDPALVKIQLDVGWAVAARQDPIAILNKYKDRVVSLHVKDVGALADDPHAAVTTPVGQGTVDWQSVIGAAHRNGVQHYFYEQEPPFKQPILESARISANYLSQLSF
jgi:sugar phosphate isomerase/epimerase